MPHGRAGRTTPPPDRPALPPWPPVARHTGRSGRHPGYLAAMPPGSKLRSGAPGSLVGTTFVTLEFVDQERAMTTQMTRFPARDRLAILAALAAPLAAAAILLPFRASWPNTNVALLLVVVVVGVAAIGNRAAGGIAAVSGAGWVDLFFPRPSGR